VEAAGSFTSTLSPEGREGVAFDRSAGVAVGTPDDGALRDGANGLGMGKLLLGPVSLNESAPFAGSKLETSPAGGFFRDNPSKPARS
jgi:hypothetical protein